MWNGLPKKVFILCARQSLIHHSDSGLQHCSGEYQQVLQAYGVQPSMTDGYNHYQNALAERVNGILKGEFLTLRCNTFDDLKKVIAQSINAHNQLRPHLNLGMKTPEQVHNEKVGFLAQSTLV